MPPDGELVDLIEQACLEGQINGETQALAFAGLERNHEALHWANRNIVIRLFLSALPVLLLSAGNLDRRVPKVSPRQVGAKVKNRVYL
jgi:hypothetical protein